MNLKFCSTSGSPDNQAFRVRNMCHSLSTLNQSIPAAVGYFMYSWLSSTRTWNCLCCYINVKNTLSICGKLTPRSSKSIYMTNSINLPSASPVPWRGSSFVPGPSSILAYMPEKLPEINRPSFHCKIIWRRKPNVF